MGAVPDPDAARRYFRGTAERLSREALGGAGVRLLVIDQQGTIFMIDGYMPNPG